MGKHVKEVPFRNIYCATYEICLDRAATADTSMNCSGCKQFEKADCADMETTLFDIDGCRNLLHVVFSRNLKRRPNATKRQSRYGGN